MILISPSEPSELRQALKATNSPLCEELGSDILVPTIRGLLGVQRKTIADFVASLEDGRLTRELPLLLNGVGLPVLLLEGELRFNEDGRLLLGIRPTRFTQQAVHNLIRSISYVNGICVERSTGLADTPVIINELIEFIGKEHKSLLKRPKIQGAWGKPTVHQALAYFYQGIPQIGVILSQNLMKKYPCPVDLVNATFSDLQGLPMVGKQRARVIFSFLHSEHKDDNDKS
jgi:ERCC4-type nuclease